MLIKKKSVHDYNTQAMTDKDESYGKKSRSTSFLNDVHVFLFIRNQFKKPGLKFRYFLKKKFLNLNFSL